MIFSRIDLESFSYCYRDEEEYEFAEEIFREKIRFYELEAVRNDFSEQDDWEIFCLSFLLAANYGAAEESLICASAIYELTLDKQCPIFVLSDSYHKKNRIVALGRILAKKTQIYNVNINTEKQICVKKISTGSVEGENYFDLSDFLEFLINYITIEMSEEDLIFSISCMCRYAEEKKIYEKMLLCLADKLTKKFIELCLNNNDSILFENTVQEVYDISKEIIKNSYENGKLIYGIDYLTILDGRIKIMLQSSADLVFGINRRLKYEFKNETYDFDSFDDFFWPDIDPIEENYGLAPGSDQYELMREIENYNNQQERETEYYRKSANEEKYNMMIKKEDEDIRNGVTRVRYQLVEKAEKIKQVNVKYDDEVPF